MNAEEELFEKYVRGELSELETERLKELLDRPDGKRRFVTFVQEWTLVGEVSRRLEAARRPGQGPSAVRPGTPRSGVRALRAVRRSRWARRVWLGLAGTAAAGVLAAVWAVRSDKPHRVPESRRTAARAEEGPSEKRAEAPVPVPAAAPAPVREVPRPSPAGVPSAETPADARVPAPSAASAPAPPKPAPPEPAPPAAPATALAVAQVEEVQGEVVLAGPSGGAPGRRGSPILEGQGVRTGPQGRAVLVRPDGTRLELGPGSEIGRFEGGGRVAVGIRGMLRAQVARRAAGEGPAIFAGSFARAVVLGTRFALEAEEGRFRVQVEEGRVRLERPGDGAAVEVAAGQAGTAARTGRLDVRFVPMSRSFQDGEDGYAGTSDAMIWGAEPNRTFGREPRVKVDGSDGGYPAYGLVRWDLSGIPSSAVIRSAVVTLTVENLSIEREYRIYEMKRPWSEAEVTWKVGALGRPWQGPGARGLGDRGTEILGTVRPSRTGEVSLLLNDAGVAVIRSWVRAPARNHGFLIAADGGSDGFSFSSREAPEPSRRPKLTITYVLGK